ncbi:fatty acid--CoA ligase [Pseudooceanicola nanhaiensis]|uniref:fatty acid--CoA ligase n=1 Tax=Pseudooceanicola nanhaiensis TaxID=375761 RepID=UPI001CD6E2F2|nr:fatty acid--CoA ligase [Pseudooceanicola nanhaiensis]MCA0921875.1 fatty acid--CoA ligase [Pseudooceanicola nanhaiensis]
MAQTFAFPLTLNHVLETGLARAGAHRIHGADGTSRSYPEFAARVARFGAALAGMGLRPGAVIGMLDFDTPAYLEAFFAVPMSGAVLHTINLRLSPEQLVYTINHAEDDVLIVNRALAPLLAAVWDELRPGMQLVFLGEGDTGGLPDGIDFEDWLAAGDPAHVFPDLPEDSEATLFYTTGTTGLPKGVHFTQRQLVLHTFALAAVFGSAPHGSFGPSDVYLPLTPMFHVHAWGLPYLATMLGVTQVYPGRFQPDVTLGLLRTHGVTFTHCVPTILQMLMQEAGEDRTALQGLKMIIGGSALPQTLARAAMDRGVDIFTGYGMSETGPVLTLALLTPEELARPVEEQVTRRVLTGRTIPFVSIRVVTPEMEDVPHDGKTAGEVVVRAPWLTADYLKNAEASEDLWAGGWLHTGDIAVMHADGMLQITDRLKDVIKTGGEWVSSLALEDMLRPHPSVRDVAVVAVPDAKWGERPLAVVVPSEGGLDVAALKAELQKHVDKGDLPRFGIPERFEAIDDLPKTSVGKIDKKVLRARFAA